MSVHQGIGGVGGLTMMRVKGVVLVHFVAGTHVPFVPTIVRGNVPLAAFAPTLIFITEFAVSPGGGLGAGGVNVTVTSDGNPVTLSVTF